MLYVIQNGTGCIAHIHKNPPLVGRCPYTALCPCHIYFETGHGCDPGGEEGWKRAIEWYVNKYGKGDVVEVLL